MECAGQVIQRQVVEQGICQLWIYLSIATLCAYQRRVGVAQAQNDNLSLDRDNLRMEGVSSGISEAGAMENMPSPGGCGLLIWHMDCTERLKLYHLKRE